MCIYVYQWVEAMWFMSCVVAVVGVKIKMKARLFVVYLQSSSS